MSKTIFIILALLARTILEDMAERNATHGWMKDRWAFARNNWRSEYRDPEGPFTWREYRWWVWIGGGGFTDLWHTAKTLRLWITYGLVCYLAGWPLWLVLPIWLGHGIVHQLVYDGVLRSK